MKGQARFESVEEALDTLKVAPEPNPSARDAARIAMLAEVDAWQERRERTSPAVLGTVGSPWNRVTHGFQGLFGTVHRMRQEKPLQLATLMSILVMFAALTGGTAVANAARPGDALYGMDRFIENTWLGFAFNENQEADLRIAFAEERLEEIEDDTKFDTGDPSIVTGLDEAAAALQALLDSGKLSPEAQAEVQVWLDALRARRETFTELRIESHVDSEGLDKAADDNSVGDLNDSSSDDDVPVADGIDSDDGTVNDQPVDDELGDGAIDDGSLNDVVDEDEPTTRGSDDIGSNDDADDAGDPDDSADDADDASADEDADDTGDLDDDADDADDESANEDSDDTGDLDDDADDTDDDSAVDDSDGGGAAAADDGSSSEEDDADDESNSESDDNESHDEESDSDRSDDTESATAEDDSTSQHAVGDAGSHERSDGN